MMSSPGIERYVGCRPPPTYDWYTGALSRSTFLPSSTISTPHAPREHDLGYTHTLLFATHSTRILLARKLRGFARDTHNGIGGKLFSEETALQCILRETREEIVLTLSSDNVRFAGNVSIDVDRGEKVRIALFTVELDAEQADRVQGSDEVEPIWVETKDVLEGRWAGAMRPEHRIYLAALLHCAPKRREEGWEGPLIDVTVNFDAEPEGEDLEQGERPENHRTVRQWSLNIFPQPITHTS
ncbi:hypothetical protein PHSY_006699 [Pseudozyma hubeiensis SY62]|uniref:Nudix hydrolase domain-containing protein n=1 Tax=Pseudozyma hubeiensis (strain SY62) TaxID=1305764 RepID=R9PCK5_PSEHS|nr:hypothetical protein PHSY_006699 [Pseudozyma hubeiensis SY62]GAC99101.1 hypothetical protein PHSY_006699 [Pseudozyma hubeiensis SY62]